MGHVVCSCGWKKMVKSCVEADHMIKSISHQCPKCLFWGQWKYMNG